MCHLERKAATEFLHFLSEYSIIYKEWFAFMNYFDTFFAVCLIIKKKIFI